VDKLSLLIGSEGKTCFFRTGKRTQRKVRQKKLCNFPRLFGGGLGLKDVVKTKLHNQFQICQVPNVQVIQNVSQFKYLGMTVINKNLIQEEIKRRLNSGNACYHSVQKFSSSHVSKNIKIRIYKAIILSVVLYECRT
jgi:hypothetical protein